MDIMSNKKYKYNAILFCGFKDARFERFRFKYNFNSITRKQASGIVWAIFNVLLIFNETVQPENISIVIKVKTRSINDA